MLAKLRAWKARPDVKEVRDGQTSINFHEEYHRALRTKSYADCFNKAQLLASQASINHNHDTTLSEILLEPDQETIPSLVNESSTISNTPELRNLMLNYFNISAEASHICSHLLKSINQIHSNYKSIQRALDIKSSENFELIVFELNSFMSSTNSFSSHKNHDFKLINDKYSSVLHNLRSMRKRVGRKIKLMKYLKNTCSICVTATCGIVATIAMVIAAHTLAAIFIGATTILTFPFKNLKRKFQRFSRFSGSNKSLCKVYDQLDIAAKGTYILNRDFDTMSRLVARVHDEIEHNKTMVQFCLDRRDDRFSLQIVKELKKSDVGFREQVEELEEHVFLCLVTINRARALVIKEMKKSCTY